MNWIRRKKLKEKTLGTRTITLIGIMTAIIIVLSVTPGLGYIPIGPIDATILHIPVIILAIVEGPVAGAILGFMFGVTSLIKAFVVPTPFSFIFMNPIVSVLPRILIGLLTGLIYKAIKNRKSIGKASIGIAAGIGSLINTIGVLGLIFIIYGQAYMETVNQVNNAANTSALKLIGGIALTSGLAEMLVSIIIATPICFALLKAFKRGR